MSFWDKQAGIHILTLLCNTLRIRKLINFSRNIPREGWGKWNARFKAELPELLSMFYRSDPNLGLLHLLVENHLKTVILILFKSLVLKANLYLSSVQYLKLLQQLLKIFLFLSARPSIHVLAIFPYLDFPDLLPTVPTYSDYTQPFIYFLSVLADDLSVFLFNMGLTNVTLTPSSVLPVGHCFISLFFFISFVISQKSILCVSNISNASTLQTTGKCSLLLLLYHNQTPSEK